MALGYCKLCDKLVPITPAGWKHSGSRERWWYPVEHDEPGGKPCAGHKKGI